MGTLKEEEVQGRAYDSLEDAKSRIQEFLEETCNRQRLHSALKYLTPSEFEQKQNAVEDDRAMEGAENETPCFPPLPQLLEIPRGFPHLPQRDGET